MDGDAEFAYPADVDDHERNTDATDADFETHTSGGGGWALWSRRPRDPARAPGVIISPAAHPPPDVVAGALGERTPPASPVLKERVLLQAEVAVDEIHREGAGGRETSLEADTAPPSSGASTVDDYTTDADADADARRTPTTAATTMPSSPLSASITVNIPSKLVEVVESKVKTESTPAAAVSSTATGSAPAVPSATAPESAPTAAPAPIAPKKSWASLLRPGAPAPASASASSTTTPTSTPGTISPANGAISTTAPRKNGLPTSSVVGFSVPAGLASGERLVPRGLVNTGNMCFANAVLQVLGCCPPFAALVGGLRGVLGPVEATAGAPWAAPLLRATGEFLREFDTKAANGSGNGKEKGKGRAEAEEEDEEGEAFIPTYVYDALKGKKRFDSMRGGHQEDAEEFLGFYLDALEEELLALGAALEDAPRRTTAVTEEREEEAPGETEDGWLEVGRKNRTVMTRTIKSAESPITRIFGGKFRSTLRAPGTKDSVIVEDWRSLRLDIQRDGIHTIEDALAFISHPQAVQLTHPARPGAVLDASQQVLIDALPPVLVLHVKRFCYDAVAGGVIKIGKQVTFGPELDIGSDVMAPTARKPARYKLFGVVYHHGVSASGGHYTLDVLHPARFPSANASLAPREGWVRIDDELVSDVRPDDVFGATARDDSRCAYLLFYRRVR
ncbi:hypothetical protein C8R43DRAFT_902953 [Mycena crocata]|nr:hypothetical protein C8R43DRAFT_902953 [Mycena crocata]